MLDSVGFVISNLRGNLCSSEMQTFFFSKYFSISGFLGDGDVLNCVWKLQ